MKLGELINSALVMAAMSFSAFGCSGCQPEEKKSKYEGKSVQELVDMISTPKEAQQCIDDILKYDNWRRDNPKDQRIALNGAEYQSLEETLRRGKGVCRDFSIFSAAALKDNNIPSYVISVHWVRNDNEGHSEMIYQGSNGKWGTVGTVLRDPKFNNYPEIANAIAAGFGEQAASWAVYDLNSQNLINGTNEGLVRIENFEIQGADINGTTITGTKNQTQTGYETEQTLTYQGGSQKTSKKITNDFFDDEIIFEEQMSIGLYLTKTNITSRYANQLPKTKTTEEYLSGILQKTTLIENTYNANNQLETEQIEMQSASTQKIKNTYTYDSPKLKANWKTKLAELDLNNDGTIDKRYLYEKQANGSEILLEEDVNPCDGVWD